MAWLVYIPVPGTRHVVKGRITGCCQGAIRQLLGDGSLTFQSESRSPYSISTIQVNLVPSSEVDIIPQARLASLIEQMDQSSAFCHSCSPANQNNNTAMGLRLS